MNERNSKNGFDKLFKSSTIINKPKKVINNRLKLELTNKIKNGIRMLHKQNRVISKNDVYVQCRLYLFEYFFNKTPYSHYVLDNEIFDLEEIRNVKRKSKNRLLLHYLNHFKNSGRCGLVFRIKEDVIEINEFNKEFKILVENPNSIFFVFNKVDITITPIQYNEFEILSSLLDGIVSKEFNKLNGWWDNVLRLMELRHKNYNEYLKCIFLRINGKSDSKYKKWIDDFGVDREDFIRSLLKDYNWNDFDKRLQKLNHLQYFKYEDYNNLRDWIKKCREKVRSSKKFISSYKSLHN